MLIIFCMKRKEEIALIFTEIFGFPYLRPKININHGKCYGLVSILYFCCLCSQKFAVNNSIFSSFRCLVSDNTLGLRQNPLYCVQSPFLEGLQILDYRKNTIKFPLALPYSPKTTHVSITQNFNLKCSKSNTLSDFLQAKSNNTH